RKTTGSTCLMMQLLPRRPAMLDLLRPARRVDEPISRRTLLRVGSLGFAGLTLPELFRARAAGRSEERKEISVIVLFFSGGPGHFETWAPKPGALAEIKGPFAPIATAVPGVQFCELLPRQARIADKLAVIRSMNHTHNDHDSSQWMLSGYFYSRLAEQNGF